MRECKHTRFLFGRCASCRKTKPEIYGAALSGFSNPDKTEELKTRRLQRVSAKAFQMRERGHSVEEIAFKTHVGVETIHACLNDQENIRRRIKEYNEQLRSYSPQALAVIKETLFTRDPKRKKQQTEVAQWVLESTKVIGKDSPVNIFVNAPGVQNVILNHEEIEAARSVAALMAARNQLPEGPKPEIIDAEIVATTEEKPVGGATSSPDPPSV